MFALLTWIATVFITLPILTFIVIFIVSKSITKNGQRSARHAVDGSTIFFIIAVYFLNQTIWGQSFLWIILLVMIFIAMIVSIVHWKVREEVDFLRIARGTWRLQFLLFSFSYLVLIIVGIVRSIVHAVS